MKILHLIYDHINNPWVGGGGAVRCYEINRRLTKRGHYVAIICGNYPEAKDYETDGLNFKFLGFSRNYILSTFSYSISAINFLNKHSKEFDIVIEDFAPWNPVFSVFFHEKTVLQIHQKEGINIFKRYLVLGIPFMIIESTYPKLYKRIINVSGESKEKFRVNAKVISNGIPDEFLNENPVKGQYIGYIGRFDMYHKGLDLLLDAASNINIPLFLAGKGKDEKKLSKVIEKKGLKSRVKLKGFLTGREKIDFIKNSLFIVMPSRYEAQGIVALEAAALGKSLIVSDIHELRYVTENGFGISFRSENVESLKQTINYLLDNEILIDEMGKRGRQYAAQFTWDNIAEEYEKFLLSVLENNN